MDTLKKELTSNFGMRDQISLSDLCISLHEILGAELISIILYGNATLHDYHPSSNDKNVLIVVRTIDIHVLSRIMKPVNKAKEMGFDSLLMTKENLASSTDVFPIKYQSMKESHVVLRGEDVMEVLEISPVYLRLRCEQELRIMAQRLDKYFLENRGRYLKEMLSNVIIDFIETLRAAVMLKTNEMPPWDNAIDSVSSTFDIDALILRDIMKMHSNEIKLSKKQIEDHYNRFMLLVDQLARKVDQLD